jgi:hypothetical protein
MHRWKEDNGEHRKMMFVRMRNGHVFSKIRVEGQISKSKKIKIKLNCLFLKKNPLLNENEMDIFLRECYK